MNSDAGTWIAMTAMVLLTAVVMMCAVSAFLEAVKSRNGGDRVALFAVTGLLLAMACGCGLVIMVIWGANP